MLTEKTIVPAQTKWVVSIVSAPKKDGSLHFCVDYQKRDALIVKKSHARPLTKKCTSSSRNATLFSNLDGNSGYCQIEVKKADWDKMAFIFHHGLYRFTRSSFGLKISLGTFQQTMDVIFSQSKGNKFFLSRQSRRLFKEDCKPHRACSICDDSAKRCWRKYKAQNLWLPYLFRQWSGTR